MCESGVSNYPVVLVYETYAFSFQNISTLFLCSNDDHNKEPSQLLAKIQRINDQFGLNFNLVNSNSSLSHTIMFLCVSRLLSCIKYLKSVKNICYWHYGIRSRHQNRPETCYILGLCLSKVGVSESTHPQLQDLRSSGQC